MQKYNTAMGQIPRSIERISSVVILLLFFLSKIWNQYWRWLFLGSMKLGMLAVLFQFWKWILF